MTNDDLASLKKEAVACAATLKAAGLHNSRTYTLINSDLPIVIDLLIRANVELKNFEDEAARKEMATARKNVIKALKKTGAFPDKWINERFGGKNV